MTRASGNVDAKGKRKTARKSPTQRSLAYLRKHDHVVEIVERWNPFARRRHDLFGIGDLLALSPGGDLVLVQTTSASNVSARVKKIAESEHIAAIRKCQMRVVVHGWNGDKLREVDCS